MSDTDYNINWFPGHMAKAMRQIREKLNLCDVVIEVLDSRAPFSSINKALKEMIKDKPLLFVMNKIDMADERVTKEWLIELNKTTMTVCLNSLDGVGNIKIIEDALAKLLKDKIDKAASFGKSIYPIKAIVAGIPNSGKSTLMNNLAKRKAMTTGDKPGVTKSQTYLKASDKLILLDNPGILWPKFENQNQAKLLCLIGSIKDEIVPINVISEFGIDVLKKYYPNELKARFKLDTLDKTSEELLYDIGRKRGCLLRGGEIDIDKANEIFLRDLRSGKIGRMTFERVGEPL